MVTYTKISPKMVNPRDLAGEREEEEEALWEEADQVCCNFDLHWFFRFSMNISKSQLDSPPPPHPHKSVFQDLELNSTDHN